MVPVARIGALVLAAAGCGAGAPAGAPLAPGATATASPTGLRHHLDLARGVLAYHAAFAPDGDLVTVELGLDFELVRRAGAAPHPERLRTRLGPAEYDINDLAVGGGATWIASDDGTVRAYTSAGAEARRWHLGSAATSVAVSADEALVATGTADGVVCLRRIADQALLQCARAHQGRVTALAFGGGALISGSWDGSARRWQLPGLARAGHLEGLGAVNDLAVARDGRVAIATSAAPPRRAPGAPRVDHGALLIWAPGGEPTRCRAPAAYTAVAWSVDGGALLAGDGAHRLWVCDARTGATRFEDARWFQETIRALAVSADGRRVAAAAWTPDLEARSVALFELLYPIDPLAPRAP